VNQLISRTIKALDAERAKYPTRTATTVIMVSLPRNDVLAILRDCNMGSSADEIELRRPNQDEIRVDHDVLENLCEQMLAKHPEGGNS
jgi:hypothetical protein